MYTKDFLNAFDHAMLYEVGGFWNPSDPDVQAGKIETKEQKRKVGYVNHPADPGGETKYGVSARANPELDIRNLNLNQALAVYFKKYWLLGKCDKLPDSISVMHFDACVNHGVGRANRMLQEALGVKVDGVLGPVSIKANLEASRPLLINRLNQIRVQFYRNIVANKPSQSVFLKGWLLRIDEVTKTALATENQNNK